jgi:hypothetical protein
MAAAGDEDEMLSLAKKQFRSRCFTTEQLKNLSSLFLSNQGKYKFFDQAYDHVSDMELFSTLGAEIGDAYYLKRFKALIEE